MERQHDHIVYLFHTDPANIFVEVGAFVDGAAVIRCQEIGAGGSGRQIGIHLNQAAITVAVLEVKDSFLGFRIRLGVFCSRLLNAPGAAIKHEGIIFIQCELTAIGEAKYRSRRQEIGLTGSKAIVKMEGQHNGTVHIFHTDPTHILIEVFALINAAAVIAGGKVLNGEAHREIGIQLNQLVGTVAVLEADSSLLGCRGSGISSTFFQLVPSQTALKVVVTKTASVSL